MTLDPDALLQFCLETPNTCGVCDSHEATWEPTRRMFLCKPDKAMLERLGVAPTNHLP